MTRPPVPTTPAAARTLTDGWRAQNLTVGLVPTMGALHAGHASLITRARRENDRVLVSIFVNPLQFGPNEDFHRYPRPFEADVEAAVEHGADAVYNPTVEAMYREGATTRVDPGPIAEPLEGRHRPGHFVGVATVVAKLLIATRPTRAYFGRKDAQQLAVVTRMAADLDTGTEIVPCPIVRDPDGLALSSRNAYLSAEQRRQALALSQALKAVNDEYESGLTNLQALNDSLRRRLAAADGINLDYAELVDPETFSEPGPLAVLAARVGTTRLIDNHLLGTPFESE